MEGLELEERVLQHEKAINSNILPRLEKVEVNQKSHEEKMAAIEKSLIDVQMGQKDLATTVLKSGQTSTELQMQSQQMITQLLGIVDKKNESETTVTIKKLDTREKIAVALFGSLFGAGGAAGVVAAFVALN